MRRAIAVATTAVALLAASSASASGGTLTVKSINTSKFPTVAVTVQTTGTNGTTPQFKVTENGRPAVNPSSGGGEPPAAIALLVDTSRSMAGQKMHDAIACGEELRRRAAAQQHRRGLRLRRQALHRGPAVQ